MENCNIYIYTFIITALWDIVLRKMSENYDGLPKFLQYDFMIYLQPYFKQHTLLDAALVAGFVGATTQVIILNLHSLPTNALSFVSFMILSFIISALYGFVMKFSNLFPHLEATYYKNLGVYKSMYYDGCSGLIVQLTLFAVLYVMNARK
jgi:hypothetical protein